MVRNTVTPRTRSGIEDLLKVGVIERSSPCQKPTLLAQLSRRSQRTVHSHHQRARPSTLLFTRHRVSSSQSQFILPTRPHRSQFASIEEHVKLGLAVDCINEQLNELAYPASFAGADFRLQHDELGFVLDLVGYNSSLKSLLLKCLEQMTQLHLSEERFQAIHDRFTGRGKTLEKSPLTSSARMPGSATQKHAHALGKLRSEQVT